MNLRLICSAFLLTALLPICRAEEAAATEPNAAPAAAPVGKDMLKKTGYASLPEALDLSSWREFQNGVSLLLDIPLSLYDASGALLVPSIKESPVCAAVQGCPKGAAQCSEFIASSIAQVVETGNVYVYKCHATQYFFAIPVVVDARYAFVAVGGHVYLEGSDIKDFYEGITGYGFDGETVSKLRAEVKTMPPKALFTIPSIVNNMAAPILRCVPESGSWRKEGLN